jgi:hypothetical protein
MGLVSRMLSCAVLLGLGSVSAGAAPPASCAQKFVGSWTIRVNATGQTYPALVRPNGTVHITCPLCPSEGTWTCNGNTFTSIETSSTSTLSSDGRTMTGSCCVSTRVGRAAVAARPAAPGDTPRRPSASRPKSVACDTIKVPAPAFKGCDEADFALQAARTVREKYPQLAADQYKQAAAAARRVGDNALELTILREAAETPAAK